MSWKSTKVRPQFQISLFNKRDRIYTKRKGFAKSILGYIIEGVFEISWKPAKN